MPKTLHTLSELEYEAQSFVARLVPSKDSATLITLSGELGVGKTAFTKALAKALGVDEAVTSPTFVLEKIYLLPENPQDDVLRVSGVREFKRLIHIDAYRLKEGKELSALGFDELMREVGNLVVLEWPEQVAGALPVPAVAILLVLNPDGLRTISYTNHD